mmetsp:Transcript_404/g.891  ORF Transcript_404/g.891 Transcript_404/m.891 type:complete len:261 (+) Transcript_404:1193-1975(+)
MFLGFSAAALEHLASLHLLPRAGKQHGVRLVDTSVPWIDCDGPLEEFFRFLHISSLPLYARKGLQDKRILRTRLEPLPKQLCCLVQVSCFLLHRSPCLPGSRIGRIHIHALLEQGARSPNVPLLRLQHRQTLPRVEVVGLHRSSLSIALSCPPAPLHPLLQLPQRHPRRCVSLVLLHCPLEELQRLHQLPLLLLYAAQRLQEEGTAWKLLKPRLESVFGLEELVLVLVEFGQADPCSPVVRVHLEALAVEVFALVKLFPL